MKYLENSRLIFIFLDIHMPAISRNWFYQIRETGDTMVILSPHTVNMLWKDLILMLLIFIETIFIWTFSAGNQRDGNDFQALSLQIRNVSRTVFFVRADYSLLKIPIADILFIEGLDDYIKNSW